MIKTLQLARAWVSNSDTPKLTHSHTDIG